MKVNRECENGSYESAWFLVSPRIRCSVVGVVTVAGDDKKTLKLKVAKAIPSDVGHGRARVPFDNDLNILQPLTSHDLDTI